MSLIHDETAVLSTNTPIVITVQPTSMDYPFIVYNNQISYSFRNTLDLPCNYIIEGRILDLEGEPYTSLIVNVQMLSELAPDTPAYIYPGQGTELLGPSGWSALLVNWDVAYEVWLTSTIGGDPLSARVYVPPRGCNNNVATFNFIQVRPLD